MVIIAYFHNFYQVHHIILSQKLNRRLNNFFQRFNQKNNFILSTQIHFLQYSKKEIIQIKTKKNSTKILIDLEQKNKSKQEKLNIYSQLSCRKQIQKIKIVYLEFPI
ncbi:hypothetical protein TTHERM_000128778 (macronuclear) [Tetrahymena thermophila SB210]|uniref:Uncharacterized protein n=1 Tax=Tetrahymena thermophila (strain SB210) TaxID=312017 RepID=W7XCQ6_TETTS|nr:hypothetical protein TTHERM_000128778 [Tetrahymena thermophila SB210]EWS74318.1 hypothetical protein TTHERM_000128778 [Tetrahymena thermophila SB210]|eukprot:XP_012653139.1 hypothetical protein TTHERM_000128778 [Tetrahymena thermophila SB210]